MEDPSSGAAAQTAQKKEFSTEGDPTLPPPADGGDELPKGGGADKSKALGKTGLGEHGRPSRAESGDE